MRKRQKLNYFVYLAFFAMLSFCTARAEQIPNYDLKLNMETEEKSVPKAVDSSVERHYELTLDLDIDSKPYVSEKTEDLPAFDYSSYLPKETAINGFNPVITINNSYYDTDVSQDGYQKSNTFTLSDGSGKWQFKGALERKYFNQIEGEKNSGSVGNNLRASSTDATDNEPMATSAESSEFKTSLASKYSLEVVYSFKPTIKGKVSFTQSTLDDFDAGKSIQAEAIVETSSNMQIKAGVKNQFETDAISNDTNSGKENKVWTEFILKF